MKMECFWPGLPAAWHLGDLRGLVICVVFGWSLTLLLASTFIWPLWFHPFARNSLWGAVGIFWIVETVRANWGFQNKISRQSVGLSQEFLDAQQSYLEGNWFDAEALLLDILDRKPRDAESLLMLVGVLRHTKRWQAALRRLSQLEYLESARRWLYEISRERKLIEAAMAAEEPAPGTASGENVSADDSTANADEVTAKN